MGLVLAFNKANAQPSFSVGAAITGTVEAGQELTCTYTVVRARPSNVTVRWYSYADNLGTDQVLIATAATYTLTGTEVGRYIRAIVTATNPAGTVQSTSAYTAAVATSESPEPPTIATAATITGTADVGETLTVTYDFDNESSVAIQWYSYATEPTGSPLVGTDEVELGTASTQALTESEAGRWIVAVVTATNAVGTAVTSDSVAMAGVDPYEPIAPTQYSPPAYDDSALTAVYCNAGDDLQAKLNNLRPGQKLIIEAGAVFQRLQYTIPNTYLDGSDWAYIVSSAVGSLPAEGTRVTEADAVNMPTLRVATFTQGGTVYPGGAGSYEALNINAGVSKLRIVGIEIDSAYSGPDYNRALVHVGRDGYAGTYGEEVVFDRCYVHGEEGQRSRDGIGLYFGTKKVAIKECLIDWFAGATLESHGIHIFTSYGPVLIHNNTIRAGSINIFMCDSASTGTIEPTPQDITITKNLIEKRLEWMTTSVDGSANPSWDGVNHQQKCLIESKGSHRVLIEGNVLLRAQWQGQPGRPFYASPDGGSGCSDVDFKNNLIVEAGTFGFAADADRNRGYGYERIRIRNNIYYKMRVDDYQFAFGGLSTGFGRYVDISRNTIVINNRTSKGLIGFGLSTPIGVEKVKFQDNICQGGLYFIKGTGVAAGETSLAYHVDDYTATKNVCVGMLSSQVGTTDADWEWFRATSLSAAGFVNTSFTELGHFALSPASSYYTASTTGGPIGADVSAVIAAVNASDIPTLG